MEKLFLLLTFFILVNLAAAQTEVADQADENTDEDTTDEEKGITPDSFLWGLDNAIDRLSLLLTFDEGKKARKGLEIARERLLEVKAMAEENKFEDAEKAKEEHGRVLSRVKQNIERIERDDSKNEIKEVIEIENEVEMYDDEVEQTFNELKIKIEVRGEITDKQKEMIDSILNSLKGQTGEVEIEIKNKKDKTKIRIKQESDKDDGEIEEEIDDIENSVEERGREGLEKALELRVEHVEREIKKSEDYLDKHDREELKKHLELAREILDEADDAIDKNEFEHSRELILRALRLAVSVRGESVSSEELEAKREKLTEKREGKEAVEERRELLKKQREELKENKDELRKKIGERETDDEDDDLEGIEEQDEDEGELNRAETENKFIS